MVQAVDGPLAGVVRQSLGRLGISENLRIEAGRSPVLVERLVLVDGLTDHGNYISPLVMECLDRLASGIGAAAGYEKIFVSRGSAVTRRLLHEQAIVTRATDAGFRAMAPGGMPFADQVAAFKSAQRIVGVMGATLANLAFAPPGAEVFMLAPANMPDTFFYLIAGLRGLRLIDVRCVQAQPSTSDQPWDGALELDAQDEQIMLAHADGPLPPSNAPSVASLFDHGFYRTANGSVAAAEADPLEHYCRIGWREHRDPSAAFSTARYLAAYPDVAAVGMNPLLHYIEHGRAEGRPIFASDFFPPE
jgi:hypothetical protein